MSGRASHAKRTRATMTLSAGLDMLANKGHVFAEGNKRTAITSTIAFLELNDYVIDTENQDEVVEFILEVAKGNSSLRNTKKWLEQRIKKRSRT